MPAEISLGEGRLLRPLLTVSQQAILDYANYHQLNWVEDPSNQDSQFDRNYLRNEVMPLLTQRWQGLDAVVTRSARHCQDAQSLLSALMHDKMLAMLDLQNQSLNINKILAYSHHEQQWLIREWLDYLQQRMPSEKVLKAILSTVLLAEEDTNPQIDLNGKVICRYQNQLYCMDKTANIDCQQVIIWQDRTQSLNLDNNGALSVQAVLTDEIGLSLAGDWQIKYRQGGEKIKLPFRKGRHNLKTLYQEAKIAPWLRAVMPLLYIDGELAAIADYWIGADFLAADGEQGFKVVWQTEC